MIPTSGKPTRSPARWRRSCGHHRRAPGRRRIRLPPPRRSAASPRMQRAPGEVVAEVGAEGGALSAGTESAIESARSGGSPIASGVRPAFEGAFDGADFSGVRLHVGPAAAQPNRQVDARTFTIGQDIFFRDGSPDLASDGGRQLLAHELTHTIQQSGPSVGRKVTAPDAGAPHPRIQR